MTQLQHLDLMPNQQQIYLFQIHLNSLNLLIPEVRPLQHLDLVSDQQQIYFFQICSLNLLATRIRSQEFILKNTHCKYSVTSKC